MPDYSDSVLAPCLDLVIGLTYDVLCMHVSVYLFVSSAYVNIVLLLSKSKFLNDFRILWNILCK